jgi:2-dehydro-3-deoxygalactonokinase
VSKPRRRIKTRTTEKAAHVTIVPFDNSETGFQLAWLEAPYIHCPAGLAELAEHLCLHLTQLRRKIWFVPGVMRRAKDNTADVMRGEETQIFGTVKSDSERYHFILPGTHSKWALVEDGKISWFMTFMTGELFALLCDHSILGRLMEEGSDDDESFQRGLERAAHAWQDRLGLLSALFSVRSLGLFNELPKTGLKSYLSGLLIGAEVSEATRQFKEKSSFHLIGTCHLSHLYAKALRFFGLRSQVESENQTARGLALIAMKANLLSDRISK